MTKPGEKKREGERERERIVVARDQTHELLPWSNNANYYLSLLLKKKNLPNHHFRTQSRVESAPCTVYIHAIKKMVMVLMLAHSM